MASDTTGGMIASASAPAHTAGVYTLAKRVMNASDLDFFELAFSTRSSIFETVDSPNSREVLILITPLKLMQPLSASSPHLASRGTLSPVRAAVSSVVLPSTMVPSMGIFSPGLTTIIEPIATSSGSTCSSSPSAFSIFA